LTVPFARYCGQNKVEQIKRYHIAKVYRRDQPAIQRGRFREFYQCDFDIAGAYDSQVPDAEMIRIVSEILSNEYLNLGEFNIKINDRNILDGLLIACGVTEEQVRPACSAVDKLDKMCWEGVRQEMVEEKNISPEAADNIGKYVLLKGSLGDELKTCDAWKLLEQLENDECLKNDSIKKGLENMRLMLEYCHIFGLRSQVSFDLSLARGLDYYTGAIYEAVLCGTEVGSVAGGGRYDGLVSSLAGTKKQIPCVGVSIGIERLMAIIEKRNEGKPVKTTDTNVFVITPQKGVLKERLAILKELWDAGISAETIMKSNVKMLTQLQACEKQQIPICVVIGKDELEQGKVKLRHVGTRVEWLVPRESLVYEVENALRLHAEGAYEKEDADKIQGMYT